VFPKHLIEYDLNMNITVEQYNTAINGQRMQSELLRAQVLEKLGVIGNLQTALANAETERQATHCLAMQISEGRDKLQEVISAAASLADGNGCSIDIRTGAYGVALFEAIIRLRTKVEELDEALDEAQARPKSRKPRK
jgi:hypothetical protein